MVKFITSAWGLVVIGLFLNTFVAGGLMFNFYRKVSFVINPPIHPVVNSMPETNEGPSWIFRAGEIEALALDLQAERSSFSKKRAENMEATARMRAEMDELKRLRKDIEAYEVEIAKKRDEFEDYKKSFMSKVIDIQENEMKNLKTLAGTYASLTPVAAVSVFKEMDDQAAVKILSQMKPETVAAIFEEMSKTPEAVGSKDGKTLARKVAEWSDKMRALNISK